jgi:serine/threonine protein phosphatase PrpC
VQVGSCSERGPRDANQDSTGYVDDAILAGQRGLALAIADGLGGHRAGGTASRLVVQGFLDAMQGAAPTIGVRRSSARALASLNAWLHAQGRADAGMAHAATTFTAALLGARKLHVLHIGDTRAYRLRDGHLQRLTEDHVHAGAEREHLLHRAVGLEAGLRADYAVHSLRVHDRLLLCTDGVHASLPDATLAALLGQRSAPAEEARRIVAAALAAGSQDNATALVADVLSVPGASYDELSADFAALPIVAPPSPGQAIDGFRLERLLASGRYSQLFVAEDLASGARVVLKFPTREVGNGGAPRDAFVRELWVSARVHSPFLPRPMELPVGRQTQLYAAMPFYEGATLEARLLRAPPLGLAEGLRIAMQLARALTALHRAGVVHRDVKPENVMIQADGSVLLLDLGVVRLPELEPEGVTDIPGTPSYMAPEQLAGRQTGDALSDQYALGVTLYRAFTRHYPYGEIEPFMHPRFGTPEPLTRHRPDLPAWLEHAIGRCIAIEPRQRYGDLIELIHGIESGVAQGAQPARLRRSLYERSPLRFWQALSALLFVLLLACIALLAAGRAVA